MNLAEIIEKGGVAIIPLLFLSILALGTIIERVWFWAQVLVKEQQILTLLMDAARRNWPMAQEIAHDYLYHPIGRFLFAPLRLLNPEPEVLHLALESAADDELALMRRGDKVLEAVIALSPLLGLLGTVLGLITSLGSIRIGDLGTNATDGVTKGIGESLISTAAGLVIAIVSLAFYRLFQAFWFNQVRVIRKTASELEVIYRQRWNDLENAQQSPELRTSETSNPYQIDDSTSSSSSDPWHKEEL